VKIALGILLFTSLSTTISLFGCFAAGGLTPVIACLSLVAGLLLALIACRRISLAHEEAAKPMTVSDWVFVTMALLLCWRHFGWIHYSAGASVYTLDRSNLGDLPLHIGYMNYLLRGAAFWPDQPYFVTGKLHYPFAMDLFTADFMGLGLSLGQVLPAAGMVFGALTVYGLFKWGRGFAVAGFFLAGGIAGFSFFKTGVLSDYQGVLAWKNLLLTLLIPQRGFLYAFPAGLILLWAWWKRFASRTPVFHPALEGWLWGSMPFFHFHTFIFLSTIFAIWVIWSRLFREGARILGWALPLGTIETLWLTDYFRQASIIWLKPGWMIETQNPLMFFWKNFGFMFPVVLATVYFSFKDQDRRWRMLVFPAAGIYAFLLFVMLAPWDWDNTKMMVWCYLLVLPAVLHYVVTPVRPWMRAGLFFALFFSGFVSVYESYVNQGNAVEIYNSDEVSEVCTQLKSLPGPARFATAQSYNHPVALCGHKLVAGYGGHLWSHGIKSADVEAKLKELMSGNPEWRARAKELGARYLFWGPREQKDFGISKTPWETDATLLASGPWGKIYDLGDPSK
jgi:hypothetical protein